MFSKGKKIYPDYLDPVHRIKELIAQAHTRLANRTTLKRWDL